MWISHFECKCVQNTGFMSRLKRIRWGGGDGGRPLPSVSTCVAWRDGERTGPAVTCSLKQLKMWSLMLTHAAPICSDTLLITSLKARRGAAATNLIIYLLFWLLFLHFLNKPFNLRVLWVNFHFQNDLITSGFLPCWLIMANTCINGSPIGGNQRIRLRSISAEHTTSSWADSICVLEDFQEITLDSQ